MSRRVDRRPQSIELRPAAADRPLHILTEGFGVEGHSYTVVRWLSGPVKSPSQVRMARAACSHSGPDVRLERIWCGPGADIRQQGILLCLPLITSRYYFCSGHDLLLELPFYIFFVNNYSIIFINFLINWNK